MNPTKNDIARHGDMTPAKANALIDALLFGSIWSIQRGSSHYRAGDRHHHKVTTKRLENAGLIEYQFGTSPYYAGGYVLTDRGREIARSLDDTESSASRQHFIDTGEYLPYGAREELNPPDFKVGDVVNSRMFDKTTRYEVVASRHVNGTWFYDVIAHHADRDDQKLESVIINTEFYQLVDPEPQRDWTLLAPVAAQAATLVALGRGDEVVEDYEDGVITALDLLADLVEAGR